MHRSFTYLLAALLCALALFGCEEPNRASEVRAGEDQQILRRGNGGDPGTLDPALAEDVHAFNVLADLYEGLVGVGPDGSVVPGVAEQWTVSPDGREYRFALRSDAAWSNGDPVTAGDFVRGLRRVAHPDTASAYSFLLEPIRNFADVKAGNLDVTKLGIRADDDTSLVIQLEEPVSHFLAILAMPIASPMHAAASPPASYVEPDAFVGNGAYVLESRQVGAATRLKRNPRYWDAETVSIKRIEYLPLINETSELNLYRADELHVTASIPAPSLPQVLEERPAEVRIAPKLALYYIAFDLTEAPFDDRQLRKALSMAIDRDQIVRLIGRGERPAYGVVPDGVANHDPARYAWMDADDKERIVMAREAYAAAGYGPENPLSIKLTYDVGDVHELVALAVTSMWRDTLGVETELQKMEWKYFLSIRSNRSAWQAMRFAWFGDYNDPMTFMDIFRSGSEQNLARYDSTAYDRLVATANVEQDQHDRGEAMTLAEQTLLDDYAIAPVYFYVSKHLVKPNVAGFEDNVLDRHPSRFLSFKDDVSEGQGQESDVP